MDPCGGVGSCLSLEHVHSSRSDEVRDGRQLTGTTTEVAALGPYFAVELHRPGQRPDPPWRPMAELLDHPEPLQERIESVRRLLAAGAGIAPGAIQWRVAASTVHLGLVARLLAPALATAVLTGRGPQSGLTEMFWQPAVGGPFPLSLPAPLPTAEPDCETGDDRESAHLLTWLTTGPIGQLTHAMLGAGAVSEKVLQGNVASAVHSAAQQIGVARPDLGDRTTALLRTVTHHPPLRGTGRHLPSGQFQRHSCCLIYRALGPTSSGAERVVCGDCVLAAD